MYRLCSNASRVSHRTWMGARTRRVCEHMSSRHGGAVSEAAVEGTRAWTALGHREVPKKVPTAPLSMMDKASDRIVRSELSQRRVATT